MKEPPPDNNLHTAVRYNPMGTVTILLHLYYPGSWALISRKCAFALQHASKIIITVCHEDVMKEITPSDKIVVLQVTNKGKDIGGKLAAMAYYIHYCEKTAYIVLLHDKISPQTINADYWLEKLYSIFTAELFTKALAEMAANKKTGIIGSKAFLKNEYLRSGGTFATTNDVLLRELIAGYGLICKNYDFIAGTIFIGKSPVFEKFFLKHAALDAREPLEIGNVLDLEKGTYTHSWERLLCLIAEDQGYSIKGI